MTTARTHLTTDAPARPPSAEGSSARRLLSALDTRGTVFRGRELLQRNHIEPRGQGVPLPADGLARLLPEGLPRGTVVELVGSSSCGRFATALASLHAVTAAGEAAALVDRGSCLDPQDAATAGVVLERLLWVRPQRLPESLTVTEMLVTAGFRLVVLDLGLPPVRGRAPLAAWLRLARACQERDTTVLISSPSRLSGCAPAIVIRAATGRGLWLRAALAPPLLEKLTVHWSTLRHRGQHPDHGVAATFTTPEAVFGRIADPMPDRLEVRHAQTL